MSYDDALSEAVRAVIEMDLPEEDCSEAVQSRAAMLAGFESDESATA
jgi:hypothetical protein